jgi:hypothetical protein
MRHPCQAAAVDNLVHAVKAGTLLLAGGFEVVNTQGTNLTRVIVAFLPTPCLMSTLTAG